MRMIRSCFHRLRSLFRKEQLEREFRDELASHLEMHIADNLRAGLLPEEARRVALMQLGGMEQAKESYRERRGLPLLETLGRICVSACGCCAKNPAFTAVAVLTLRSASARMLRSSQLLTVFCCIRLAFLTQTV